MPLPLKVLSWICNSDDWDPPIFRKVFLIVQYSRNKFVRRSCSCLIPLFAFTWRRFSTFLAHYWHILIFNFKLIFKLIFFLFLIYFNLEIALKWRVGFEAREFCYYSLTRKSPDTFRATQWYFWWSGFNRTKPVLTGHNRWMTRTLNDRQIGFRTTWCDLTAEGLNGTRNGKKIGNPKIMFLKKLKGVYSFCTFFYWKVVRWSIT